MNDELISMFIDDEMNLEEKAVFVRTVRCDGGFADDALALLDQEKLLRSDVASVIPPVVLPGKRFRLTLWNRGPFGFVTGLVAALLLFFLIQPFMMQEKEKKSVDRIPYRFVVYQPDAQKAEIVGSFTDWKAVSMTPTDDYWQITLDLPAGEHRFAYIIDGRHQISDPTIPIREKDDFGGENSILEVQWSI